MSLRVSRRSKTLLALALCAAGVTTVVVGIGPRPVRRPGANLILVSIDTLRPDHLGVYGYAKPTSPEIDAFARDAVVFRHVFSSAPSTLVSHATLLTSLIPQHHMAAHSLKQSLPGEALTLAEVLRSRGYETLAIVDSGQMLSDFGLNQGFETYLEREYSLFHLTVREATTRLGHLRRPLFLFLHTYETHHPYRPRGDLLELLDRGCESTLPSNLSRELLDQLSTKRPPISPQDLAHVVAAYDAEIRSMDEAFGELLRELRARGLYDDSMIVLTSDHGEEFGEHGRVGWHSHTLFDELLRIPLVVKFPAGRAGHSAVDAPIRSLDVAPTVLDALGLDVPPVFEGRSAVGCLEGGCSEDRPVVAWGEPIPGLRPPLEGFRTQRWKLFGTALFSLGDDPLEQNDLSHSHPDEARALQIEMQKHLSRRPGLAPQPVEISAEVREKLQALGYLR